jgi:hypothetical protein
MYDFYRALRELESEVGHFQAFLVDTKILCTEGMIAQVRIDASESDIVNALTDSNPSLDSSSESELMRIRTLAIELVRKAECLLVNAEVQGNLPEVQRGVVTVEFCSLLECIDAMVSRFLGGTKMVSRKYGPHLQQFLIRS